MGAMWLTNGVAVLGVGGVLCFVAPFLSARTLTRTITIIAIFLTITALTPPHHSPPHRAAASLGRDSIGFLVQREGQGGAGATSGGGATTSGAAGGEGGAGEGVGAADSGSGDGASGSGGGESGAGPSDAAGSISAVSKSGSGSDTSPSPATADLVDYEGMLLSAAAAHRRRFFASLLQRSAKMHRRLGGGSLTLVPVLPGVPATGQAQGDKARRAIERMTTLVSGMHTRRLSLTHPHIHQLTHSPTYPHTDSPTPTLPFPPSPPSRSRACWHPWTAKRQLTPIPIQTIPRRTSRPRPSRSSCLSLMARWCGAERGAARRPTRRSPSPASGRGRTRRRR